MTGAATLVPFETHKMAAHHGTASISNAVLDS